MREFVHIDDAVNALPKAEQKALSKPNAMAYNRLKQTIKKELKNDEFSSIVESFRANPVEESEEESEEESTEESTEEVSSTSDSEGEVNPKLTGRAKWG